MDTGSQITRVSSEALRRAVSQSYFPAQNRDGAWLTFETALIGTGESAAANLFQEFLVGS